MTSWLTSGRPRQFSVIVAEHPMLDLVPLAGARWEMTYVNREPQVRRQILQRHLPQSTAAAVAASSIGGDQQFAGPRIALGPHLLPPPADRAYRELRRVVIDAHAHPALVQAQVENSVRNDFAQLLSTKSWITTSSGSPLGCHSRPPFLNGPTSSFFLVSTEITGWPRC